MGAFFCAPGIPKAQPKQVPKSSAQLELTMEVATTTEDGYPSAIRITLRNTGGLPVDMPMPEVACLVGGGGMEVRADWHPVDTDRRKESTSSGAWCTADVFPSLQFRVENEWIRLRPGEFITATQSMRRTLRERKPGPGIIELWAEYIPPEVKPDELAALEQAGYNIPTEKIETEHRSFNLR